MLLNAALFTGLLLAPGALAVSSRLAAQLVERQSEHCGSGDTHTTIYNPTMAGAILTQHGHGTFRFVSGTFTVPTLSYLSDTDTNPSIISSSAWIGIDGFSACGGSLLQTGVNFTVDHDGVSYSAFYAWRPADPSVFSGINISAGDDIRLTVVAMTTTIGIVRIENLSNGQTVSESLTSTLPLCQQNAEWIVENYDNNAVPFANFSSITFINATASGAAFYTPADAQIAEIQQNDRVLTSVSTCESSVTITYV